MQCIEITKQLFSFSQPTIIAILLASDSISNITTAVSPRSSQWYSLPLGSSAECVWRRSELTVFEFIIYGFVVPTLALFGLCANFVNCIVFMKPKMTPSAFSYLAALSWLDCISCLLIALTSLSRSFLYDSTFWMSYEFRWQTPLFGITTGAANLILACVSLDRFIYLRLGIPNGTPKFCQRTVARRMITVVILLAILINLPYFLVFVVKDDGTLEVEPFYFSKYYEIHNWFAFIFLAILPAMFLIVGNVIILIEFYKWSKQSRKCRISCSDPKNKNMQNRYKHQMKLTVTIVVVITLYLVGELPAHLTSRKSVFHLLFGGDITKVNLKIMQRVEVICTTLNAIQLGISIIVYAAINPCFLSELCQCLKEALKSSFACWHKFYNFFQRKKNHINTVSVYRHDDRHEEDVRDFSGKGQVSGKNNNNVKTISQENDISFISLRSPQK